jgi:antitoxin component YwqK of YwqJK toxin-antitoxin module
MNLEIFDDLLNDKEITHIENFLRDPKFSWFLSVGYNHYTVDKNTYDKNFLNDRGEFILLTHTFYQDRNRTSDNYLLSDFILNRFLHRSNTPFTTLFRAKSNLQICCNSDKLHTTPHIDSLENHKVVIYYVNDSDGDTFFFDNDLKIVKTVCSKRGRFVLFNGNILHAAGFNVITPMRLNVNFNFI